MILANGKRIMPVMRYPLEDAKGNVINEPVLLKLCVIVDPDSDRDLGLVRFVLDAIRSYQEAVNKQLQYSKHMLPQMIVPPGTMVPFDDTPMAVFEHPRPQDIKFRETPSTPPDLENIANRALADIARAFSQNEIPSQVEAGKAIQALVDRDQNARAAFIGIFADFQARLMHRCLNLVARYYDTPRLITVTGDFGTEVIEGFKGAQLMHQTTVRVMPESLETKSREAGQAGRRVLRAAAVDRPGGRDRRDPGRHDGRDRRGLRVRPGRAYEIIQKIKAGPEVLFNMPPEYRDIDVPVTDPTGMPVVDPMTGMPMMTKQLQEVPGWMPREVDNTAIHRAIFARWMKSAEWSRTSIELREAARLYGGRWMRRSSAG
jgi:hypothetical protein